MKKKYLYNGNILTEDDIADGAKQSNLDIPTYLQKAGIKELSNTYNYNGKFLSPEDVLDGANQSKLNFDDYIQKAGILPADESSKKKESLASVGSQIFGNGSVVGAAGMSQLKSNPQSLSNVSPEIIDDPLGNLINSYKQQQQKASEDYTKVSNESLSLGGLQGGGFARPQNLIDAKTKHEDATKQLNEATQNAYNKSFNTAKEARDYLQPIFDKNNGKLPEDNTTVKVAANRIQRQNEVENILSNSNSLEDATGKYFGYDFTKQSEAKQGKDLDTFLHLPEVQEAVSEKGGNLLHAYNVAKGTLPTTYPSYVANKVANKISQELEDKKLTSWFYSNPSEETVNKAIQSLKDKGDWTPSDEVVYQHSIQPQVQAGNTDKVIRTTDLMHNIGYGLYNAKEGIEGTGRDIINTLGGGFLDKNGNSIFQNLGLMEKEQDRTKRLQQQEYSQTQVTPSSIGRQLISGSGQFVGFTVPMILGEAAGIPAQANAVMMFEGINKDEGRQLYPDNPLKQNAYTLLTTTFDAALFPMLGTSKAAQSLKNVFKKDAVSTIEDLATNKISQSEAEQSLMNKFGNYLKEVPKQNFKTANALTAFQLFHNGVKSLVGGRNFDLEDNMKEAINNYGNNFLSGTFLSGISALKNFAGGESSIGKTLREKADNPDETMQKIQDNPDMVENLQQAIKINESLKNRTDLSETQKDKLMGEGMKEFALNKKLKELPNKNLQSDTKEQIEKSQLTQQAILTGKNPDEVKTDNEIKLQRLHEDNAADNKKFDDQKKEIDNQLNELDGRTPENRPKIKILETKAQELEVNRKRTNEDYQRNVEKLSPKQPEAPLTERPTVSGSEGLKLFHSSKSGVENIPEGSVISELGIHLGTKETADKISEAKGGITKEYSVDIKNPIEIGDFARWEAFTVSRKLKQMGIIDENEYKSVNKETGNDKERKLIEILKSKGYDGFVYENDFEGGGKSYVAFDKKQVTPIEKSIPTQEVKEEPTNETPQNTIQEKEEKPSNEELNKNISTTEEGTGGVPPNKVEPVNEGGDPENTKIANAVNDELIKGKFGIDALDGIIAKLQDTDLSKTYGAIKERVQKGTLDPRVTREKIITQKSGNAADQAVLLYDMGQLKGREKDLRRQIIESTDTKEKEQLQRQLVDVQNDMMDNALANRFIGRDWHNIGKIRQQWIDKDFNIVDMQNEYMASKGLSELTDEQKADIQKFHDTIKDLEVQRDKAKQDLDNAISENERLKAENEKLSQLKSKFSKQNRAKRTDEQIEASNKRIQKAKDELRKMRGRMNDVTTVLPETAAIITKIAAEKVYQGVVEFSRLVMDILDDVKDIFPEWTEKDVANHLLNETANYEKYYEAGKKYDNSSKELKEKIRAYNDLNKQYALKMFEWQKDRRSDLMDKRPTGEKIIDGILRWQRFAILTWPPTIAKLIGVVVHQAVLKPLKFLAQKGWALILPKGISDKQQVWGNPTWRSLGKYYSEMVRNFSLANLKEQFSGIDTKEILYGNSFKYDEWAAAKGLLELPGRSHGYIKSFIKNPEFKFAQENIATHYISKMAEIEKQLKDDKISDEQKQKLKDEYSKWDITDPDVMERINKLSLEHGRWAIFMNDNKLVKGFQKFADKKNFTGLMLRSELPIVKIPVNYVARSFATKYGFIKALTGSKWMGGDLPSTFSMIYKGTKEMTPEQADLLGKTLTIGSIGASFFVLGYALRHKIKQNDDGSYDVGGTRVPKIFVHSPEIESVLNGAETGNSFDKKGEKEKNINGWLNSYVEADIDMAKNNPFLSMLKYGFLPNVAETAIKKESWDKKKKEFADEVGRKISDMIIPGVSKYVAQGSDNKKGFNWEGKSDVYRKSTSPNILNRVLDGIEVNIPGLRESIPGAKKSSFTEQQTKDPRVSWIYNEWKKELPNTVPTSEEITKEDEAFKDKLSTLPKEVQDNYQKQHTENLFDILGNIHDNGTVFVKHYHDSNGNPVSQVYLSAPKGDYDEKSLKKLTDSEQAQVLHLAQAEATSKTKKEMFNQ